MYFELKEKYLMAKVRPFVFVGVVIWVAYMWQLTNAWPEMVTVNILR